jgi:hypothetical protein
MDMKWPRPWWLGLVALVAVAFGAATLKEGGSVIFIDGAAREAAGHYVPFVVWFNFVAGFAYIAAGVGLWRRRRWAVWLSLAIAGATLVVFAALGVHVLTGGAYELRTVGAMTLRAALWLAIGLLAHRAIGEPRRPPQPRR